ncbi:hypothetical protein ACFQT0_22480 [Hymenobacter humi]|uniref:Uncharacterized protein n=1 Tax=Hymenobacter humi TaxID=1411620 RepID=A0ABW2UBV5_9BACT
MKKVFPALLLSGACFAAGAFVARPTAPDEITVPMLRAAQQVFGLNFNDAQARLHPPQPHRLPRELRGPAQNPAAQQRGAIGAVRPAPAAYAAGHAGSHQERRRQAAPNRQSQAARQPRRPGLLHRAPARRACCAPSRSPPRS